MDEDVLVEYSRKMKEIMAEINKVIIGKNDMLKIILTALLAGGHVLIEGMPGTAKTITAKVFAKVIGGSFKRIQFTADTLPSDIVGFYIYTPSGRSEFIKGPVFTNILLADELNRSPPRTQAALVEAMQEGQVTIEGNTFRLPQPFMVVATQLPYGYTGTYPLPEVQVDRFMFRVWSGFNTKEQEAKVLENIDFIDEMPVETLSHPDEILKIRDLIKKIHISHSIISYIEEILEKIRTYPEVLFGPSTRGAIAIYKGARALAFLEERTYVIPDDIKYLLHAALDHRIKIKAEMEIEGVKPEDIVERALSEVPVPK